MTTTAAPQSFFQRQDVSPPEQEGLLYQDEKVATPHLLLYVLQAQPQVLALRPTLPQNSIFMEKFSPTNTGGFPGRKKAIFFWETNDSLVNATKAKDSLRRPSVLRQETQEGPCQVWLWWGQNLLQTETSSPISWQTVDYWVSLSFMYKVSLKLTTVIIGSLAYLRSSPGLLLDGRQAEITFIFVSSVINKHILKKQMQNKLYGNSYLHFKIHLN